MLRDTCFQLSKYFGDRGRDSDVVLASSYLQLALVEPGEAIALLRHLNVKVGVFRAGGGCPFNIYSVPFNFSLFANTQVRTYLALIQLPTLTLNATILF